jgi:hypothetical protein
MPGRPVLVERIDTTFAGTGWCRADRQTLSLVVYTGRDPLTSKKRQETGTAKTR